MALDEIRCICCEADFAPDVFGEDGGITCPHCGNKLCGECKRDSLDTCCERLLEELNREAKAEAADGWEPEEDS